MSDAAAVSHEAETCYTAYANHFNNKDMEGVCRYIAAPYVMLIGAHPTMIAPTPEAIRKQFDGALAGMVGRGWVRSDFKVVNVTPLSSDHALLLSDIIRYKADGSVLETGRYCYTIHRADPNWQITGVTDVAPPFTGPGNVPRA
jgi:ketosteroid isomerase-like protein